MPGGEGSLDGDAALKSTRKWALVRLPFLIILSAFMLTQVGGLLGITLTALVLGATLRQTLRQIRGLELSESSADDADAVTNRVLKAGGLADTESLTIEQTRLAIVDEMDRIREVETWWARGRLLGPVLTGGAAIGFFGVGTWYWFTSPLPFLAWGGWTIGVSLVAAGGIHMWTERRKERAIELLEDQMADLADEQRQIGSSETE